MYRCAAAVFLMGLLLAAGFRPAAATEQAVDLELALAVDVSGSIDAEEAQLQRDGYVAAFRDPEVIHAIQNGMLGRIAVAYYEWAGFAHVRVIVGWTLIEDEASAHAFAARLALDAPQTVRRTSISAAIDFAVPFFENNGFDAARHVIDVSGDGANNSGDLVTNARDRAVGAGVTINGLPIMNGRVGPFGWPPIPDLDLYYERCVIGGPGAFLVVANGFEEFAEAVRRKLILEIAHRTPRHGPRIIPAQVTAERIPPPCDIGERRMREFDDN